MCHESIILRIADLADLGIGIFLVIYIWKNTVTHEHKYVGDYTAETATGQQIWRWCAFSSDYSIQMDYLTVNNINNHATANTKAMLLRCPIDHNMCVHRANSRRI